MTATQRATRMNKAEFHALLASLPRQAHNLLVDIGGKGRVVVLRWALSGSAERTEKKVLFFSQAPSMISAAHAAFTEWFNEFNNKETTNDPK